jgi:hypothetical protein
MTELHVEHFTDPACPFAFSAEPVRQRLKWHYGDQLVWHDRMIVLTANDLSSSAGRSKVGGRAARVGGRAASDG